MKTDRLQRERTYSRDSRAPILITVLYVIIVYFWVTAPGLRIFSKAARLRGLQTRYNREFSSAGPPHRSLGPSLRSLAAEVTPPRQCSLPTR